MKLLLPLYILLLISCTTRNSDMTLEDLSKIDPKFDYPLDSIINKMDIIPLETSDRCLIENIVSIKESKDYYYILSDKNQALYKFDKNGKFISKIGNKGQGPGEYISINQIEVDNAQSVIYVLDYFGQSLLLYDFDGNYIKSFKLPKDHSFNKFALSNDGIYYFSSSNSIMPNVIFFNINTSLFEYISKGERVMEKGEFYFGDTFPYEHGDRISFYHYFNDTICSIKDNRLVCEDILNLGKYQVTIEEAKDILNINKSKIQIENILSLSGYTFIFYVVTRYNDEGRKKFMAMKTDNEFYPHANLTGKSFISISNASPFFISNLSSTIIRGVMPSDLDKSVLIKYNINLEDNPVLLVYHIKSK